MSSWGFDHNPTNYTFLPSYQPTTERWTDFNFVNLLVEHSFPSATSVLMHSYGGRLVGGGRNSILAWTSPINGRIRVTGTVRLRDISECPTGSGIIWSIDHGTEAVLQTAIPAGESTAFSFSTTIRENETLYFVHDPGWDSLCDGATVQLQITTP